MAGIVLAGGRGSRMGRDKALIELDGETLVARAVRIVSLVASPVFVVADRPAKYELDGAEVVGDDRPGSGPLGGVITGLRRAGCGAHLVIACDLPLVRPELLRLLLTRVPGHDAAVPRTEAGPEPLCAVYSWNCLPALARALDEGERSVQRTLDALNIYWIDDIVLREADPRLISFTNMNEPADLVRIRAMELENA